MMSDVVVTAVEALQKRAMNATDVYALDRLELALDELLRSPGDGGGTLVRHRIRSALGHAYETLERRKAIAPHADLTTELDEPGYMEQGYCEVEMTNWISREPTFKEQERSIVMALALGADAEMLAAYHGVPILRMRERISRCRRVARRLRSKLDLAA